MSRPPDPGWIRCPHCGAAAKAPCVEEGRPLLMEGLLLPGGTTRSASKPKVHQERADAWLALVNPPPSPGAVPLEEVEALLAACKKAETLHETLTADNALRDWFWLHKEAILTRLGQARGLQLQLETRDRTITELLATLAEAEERHPGITVKRR